jgi:hypothetical protein
VVAQTKLNPCGECDFDRPVIFKDIKFVKIDTGEWNEYSVGFTVWCQYCGNDSLGMSEEEAIIAWNAANPIVANPVKREKDEALRRP